MKKQSLIALCDANNMLSEKIKYLLESGQYQKCATEISLAMYENPDDASPHNLYGILLESVGKHTAAMKHFRAACALDPTYAPAKLNLQLYGSLDHGQTPVFGTHECETKTAHSAL